MASAFTLAAVLSLRERKEAEEEIALSAVLAQRAEAERTIAAIDRELSRVEEAAAQHKGSLRPGSSYLEVYTKRHALVSARLELEAHLAKIEALRAEQHRRYVQARMDREVLSSLKQQRAHTWQRDVERREQRRLDDLFASGKHKR